MDAEFVHLEHDGKLLLVDTNGNGPAIPKMGRKATEKGVMIRLPTTNEVSGMGINWTLRRVNRIRLGSEDYIVNYGIPDVPWPRDWAWKDSTISDSAVDPVARESVYRTIHRVVSKVVITNSRDEVLLAKVSRGFFTGCWTLPGGFVDYDEHPREAAVREALEELGVVIDIPDPLNKQAKIKHPEGAIIQSKIFNEEGINWVSFTYKCEDDLQGQKISPKDDEIEDARWFAKEEAISLAVSEFDIAAINTHLQ